MIINKLNIHSNSHTEYRLYYLYIGNSNVHFPEMLSANTITVFKESDLQGLHADN